MRVRERGLVSCARDFLCHSTPCDHIWTVKSLSVVFAGPSCSFLRAVIDYFTCIELGLLSRPFDRRFIGDSALYDLWRAPLGAPLPPHRSNVVLIWRCSARAKRRTVQRAAKSAARTAEPLLQRSSLCYTFLFILPAHNSGCACTLFASWQLLLARRAFVAHTHIPSIVSSAQFL